MGSNYHIEGTISFYIDKQLYKEQSFTTKAQRNLFIDKFLSDISKIKHRLDVYYQITIDSDTYRPLLRENTFKSQKQLKYYHKEKYCQNNSRKYI